MADQNTTDKVIDLASKKFEEFSDKLNQIAHQYGPDIINAAVSVARVSALQHVILCTSFIIIFSFGSIYSYFKLKSIWPKFLVLNSIRWMDRSVQQEAEHDLYLIILWLFGVLLGVSSFILFIVLSDFDIWPFVGVFEPKLYIAHKIMDL